MQFFSLVHFVAETQDIELLCNVLVVADQLLVRRLKEMCEVALTSLSE